MKKNKFSVYTYKLFQFNIDSHLLFIWTDIVDNDISCLYVKTTNILFNDFRYVFAVPTYTHQEKIVKHLLKYVSLYKQISNTMFKNRLERLIYKYIDTYDDFYCIEISIKELSSG